MGESWIAEPSRPTVRAVHSLLAEVEDETCSPRRRRSAIITVAICGKVKGMKATMVVADLNTIMLARVALGESHRQRRRHRW